MVGDCKHAPIAQLLLVLEVRSLARQQVVSVHSRAEAHHQAAVDWERSNKELQQVPQVQLVADSTEVDLLVALDTGAGNRPAGRLAGRLAAEVEQVAEQARVAGAAAVSVDPRKCRGNQTALASALAAAAVAAAAAAAVPAVADTEGEVEPGEVLAAAAGSIPPEERARRQEGCTWDREKARGQHLLAGWESGLLGWDTLDV